jgi:hypothetical protein
MRRAIIIFVLMLGACATGPTCGKLFCTAQENAAAAHLANGGDPNFTPGVLTPGYENQYRRPSRIIAGVTPEQARDQLIAQCVSHGYQLTSTEPSRILCERDAGLLASAFLQTGAGPPPRLQLHAVAIPHTSEPGSVVVTAWLSLQAYTWTGQPGMSESSMTQRQRAEIQALLDGIRTSN